MKISLFIAAVLFYYAVSVVSSNCLHVGTVLFTTTDLVKKCWSESDKALLRARLIMQDVLPDPDCIDFSKPDVVLTLVDYFQSCFDIIGLSTYGNEQNLMYLAMSDALGGYLRGYILPLTKKAFYTGQVKYSDAKKLFRLYDDIRSFLNTNGSGWINPQKPCRARFKAKPLVISDCLGDDPCGQLNLIEKRGFCKNCCVKRFVTPKVTSENIGGGFGKLKSEFRSRVDGTAMWARRSADESDGNATARERPKAKTMGKHVQSKSEMGSAESRIAVRSPLCERGRHELYRNKSMTRYERAVPAPSKGTTKRKCKFQMSHCQCLPCAAHVPIVVPLPVLDDCKTLHTIAVPFKIRPLRNVQSRKSAFILEQYYVTVIKCFLSKCSTPDDIRHFNAQFHTWLVTQVYPHLDDEQWYPAFGGVYRIAETIRKLGADFSLRESAASDFGYIFSDGYEFRDESCGLHVGKDKVRDVSDDFNGENEPCKPKRYFFIAVVVLTLVWVCMLCLCFSTCCAHGCQSLRESSGQSGHMDSSPDSQGERRLNFHFLVKFFRKKPTETRPQSVHFASQCSPSSNRFSVHHFKSANAGSKHLAARNQIGYEDVAVEERNKRCHRLIKCKTDSETGTFEFRKCSIPFFVPPEKSNQACFQPLFTPFWPYQDDGGKIVGKVVEELPVPKTLSLSRDKDNKNKLEKLWNNISNKVIKKRVKVNCEDVQLSESQISRIQILNPSKPELEEGVGDVERGNDEKFSSCDYTESCPTTCFASTFTSSQTQVYTDFSIGSQKFATGDGSIALTHSSIECTTDESESGRKALYASETESTETTFN